MINIVIPMAGLGSRFAEAGYKDPKPFIDVLGKPMIQHVIENLYMDGARFTLIARKEHLAGYGHVIETLKRQFSVEVIGIDKLTEGTACTVLYARSMINNDDPLLIANSDQVVDFDCSAYIGDAQQRGLDGSILTFVDEERNPKWSFAKIDEAGLVTEVQEKKAISEFATVGIYYFTKGSDFVNGAVDMIINNDRVNNEFYTCPVYNYLVRDGKRVGIFNVDTAAMHGIGTPADLDAYVSFRTANVN
ncbi:MAG: capsular polysaccharide biosynthesis protein putative nucleotidyltransferase [Flaviaesturariibacter sp.]|nr:capsular polysaccharide biosynthesis protein putative nucleotidyltransferase [Flaviaesturariibacter sp.]